MSSNIKGISIEISGNTAPLQKALEGVNKKSRDLQGELKQVERLLKLDPGNTELIAQKQKLLADAVENTKDKLKSLKDAQEQVNDKFKKGEISDEQYRSFRRELVKTEQELKNLESQFEDTSKKTDKFAEGFENAEKKLKNTGDKLKGIGEKATLGITVPIVAAGGVMLKGVMDSEKAQGKLQASLGLTKDAAEDLQAVAEAVWTNGFGENIAEVDSAITIVRKNIGKLAEDEMQKVTEGAMTISGLFDQDINDVTATAGVMMKNFGIDATTAFDVITVGFQRGGDFSGELLDTLREYSPQFKSLGLSADQAMAMLLKGAQAGAWNLDKVGDSMKEFNLRAQDGSKTTADGFKAIGLDANKMGTAIAAGGDQATNAFMATITAISNIKDPVKQNTAGVALFGTQWEDVRSKVIVAMQDGKKGLDDFKGSTAAAAQAISSSDPGAALANSFKQVQVALEPILKSIADFITNVVVPAVKSLADWFTNLSPAGKNMALAIIGIIAAIGPVLVVINALIISVTSIIGVFSALAPIVAAVGAVIAGITLPMLAVVAVIVGLVAIGVALYKNWDTIKAKAGELWQFLANAFTGIKNAIGNKLSELGASIKSTWDGVVSFVTSLPGKMLEFGGNIIQGLIDGIKNKIAAVKEAIVNVTSAITDKVKNILGIASPSKVMIEFGQYTGEGLALGIGNTVNEVKKATAGLAEGVKVTMQNSNVSSENNSRNNQISPVNSVQKIVVPVSLDGRVIAEVVAKNQKYIDRFNNRTLGDISKW